jgi:hypothetical protein
VPPMGSSQDLFGSISVAVLREPAPVHALWRGRRSLHVYCIRTWQATVARKRNGADRVGMIGQPTGPSGTTPCVRHDAQSTINFNRPFARGSLVLAWPGIPAWCDPQRAATSHNGWRTTGFVLGLVARTQGRPGTLIAMAT